MSTDSSMQTNAAEAFENTQPSPTEFRFTKWDLWVGVIPLVGMLPMLLFELHGLWIRPHMQFFPLAIAGSLYFAYFGWKGQETVHPVRKWIALVMLGVTLLTYVIAVWKFSPWLAHLSAIMLFFTWALGRCGDSPWPTIMAWTGLMLTTLTLPLNYDVKFIQWLQLNSSWACAKALDALEISNLRLANVIQIKGRELFVEEACSGIGSMYALLAVAVLLLMLNRRSLLVSLLSLLTVPAWAIFGNFTRLMSIALAHEFYGRDLAHGRDHELLGIATFCLAAGCYWLTEQFFAAMCTPVPAAEPEFGAVFRGYNKILTWPQPDPFDSQEEPEDEDERRQFQAIRDYLEANKVDWGQFIWTDKRWLLRSVVGCSVVILLTGIAPAILLARGGPRILALSVPSFESEQLVNFPNADSLPAEFGDWKKVGFQHVQRSTASQLGQHSMIWKYVWDDQVIAVSMDFPFDSWHALSVCYRLSGWTIGRQTVSDDLSADQPWPWEEIEMTNDLGGRGYVCFCAFTDDLQPFVNVPNGALAARLNSGAAGILTALQNEELVVDKVTYQIQVYCETGAELSTERRAQLTAQFLVFRQLVLEAAGPAIKALAN